MVLDLTEHLDELGPEELAPIDLAEQVRIDKIIRHVGSKWVLYSRSKGSDGKRKVLGRYDSKAEAEEAEKRAKRFKHMKE